MYTPWSNSLIHLTCINVHSVLLTSWIWIMLANRCNGIPKNFFWQIFTQIFTTKKFSYIYMYIIYGRTRVHFYWTATKTWRTTDSHQQARWRGVFLSLFLTWTSAFPCWIRSSAIFSRPFLLMKYTACTYMYFELHPGMYMCIGIYMEVKRGVSQYKRPEVTIIRT